jgi:hypothetical protein
LVQENARYNPEQNMVAWHIVRRQGQVQVYMHIQNSKKVVTNMQGRKGETAARHTGMKQSRIEYIEPTETSITTLFTGSGSIYIEEIHSI